MKQKLSEIRNHSISRIAGQILSILFPVFLVFVAEINQKGNFSAARQLLLETPGILLFDILIVSILFSFTLLLVKKSWISGLITGLIFFSLSCVEFYRFRASGAHFMLEDFSLFTNVRDVAKFAKIEIYPLMLILFFSMVIYVTLLWVCNFEVRWNFLKILSGCSGMAMIMVLFLTIPTLSNTVFYTFGVQHNSLNNNFALDEKFMKNNMIAFLMENAVNMISTVHIEKPENYSKEAIETIAVQPVHSAKNTVKPNVILIMSESYADFRSFDTLGVSDSFYTHFDKMAQEGFRGTAFVPTFGGYTVKTEFELLFGLPIKGLNGTQAPQNLINSEIKQATIASHFDHEGYTTTYMHPYTSEFYDRGELMQQYSFDHLYFQEDFEQQYFHSYIDDGVPFQKAIEQIQTDTQPSFIHITTMQNHMPYGDGSQSQFNYYMEGIQNTDKRLGELMERLKQLDEPTLVLFMGDHYPFFTDEGNVYETLNITGESCVKLYHQPYLLWANYNVDYSQMPEQTVSAFYLPQLLTELAGLPETEISGLVLKQMKHTPIYTIEANLETENEVLDTLTYDLILGDQYANQKSEE